MSVEKTEVRPKRWQDRVISFSSFDVQREDRIIFFSDGITQAGMGEYRTPLGWGLESVDKFVREKIDRYPHISARELSRLLVAKAEEVDGLSAKDDITCGVVYFRSPRQLLVITGAPFNRAHDRDLAKMAERTQGRKVICGGTTANIHLAIAESRQSRSICGSGYTPRFRHRRKMEGLRPGDRRHADTGRSASPAGGGICAGRDGVESSGAAGGDAARQRYCEVCRRHEDQ